MLYTHKNGDEWGMVYDCPTLATNFRYAVHPNIIHQPGCPLAVRYPAVSNALGAPGRFQLLCDADLEVVAAASSAAKEPTGEKYGGLKRQMDHT